MNSGERFKSMDQLFMKYPWRTVAEFVPLARRDGFSDEDARKFLNESAPRDTRLPNPRFVPIFSTTGGSYQFDTPIQRRLKPFPGLHQHEESIRVPDDQQGKR